MTSRTTFTALLVLFAASTIASASCGGGSDTKIPPPPKAATSSGVTSSSGETTVTTGTGGAGGAGGMGSTTTAGGTGGMTTCVEASECPGMTTDCQTRACLAGVCGFIYLPAGAHLPMQTVGDCKVVVCDGAGSTMTVDDDADPVDDKNPCTDDGCAAGAPTHPASASGAVCSGPNGGKVCDGNSACVECVANADCASSICQLNKCVPGSCLDTVKNGAETDIDCGGTVCNKCADGKVCVVAGDCSNGVCTGGHCKAPTCTDGVKNGSETDLDCGGSCTPCAPTKGCAVAADCTSKVCTGGVCQAPSCTDGVLNGSESDIDCGSACSPCAIGKKCNNTNANCTSQTCTGNLCVCPTGMKTVPKSGGNGGTYCIDTTEVTNDQYTVFWGSSHTAQGLPGVCASKISFTPKVGWPHLPAEGAIPVTGVDWCDAYAYCDYFGKHLCGKVSSGPNTTLDDNEVTDTTKSEWYNACTAQGANDYPYGSTYNYAKCHGVDQTDSSKPAGMCGPPDNASGTCAGPVAVSSPLNSTCVGGVPGVLGMSGNVAEWENSCDDAANPTVCHVRGGSHCETGASPNVALRCNEIATQPVGYQGCDVGFRCCL